MFGKHQKLPVLKRSRKRQPDWRRKINKLKGPRNYTDDKISR